MVWAAAGRLDWVGDGANAIDGADGERSGRPNTINGCRSQLVKMNGTDQPLVGPRSTATKGRMAMRLGTSHTLIRLTLASALTAAGVLIASPTPVAQSIAKQETMMSV